ncbi:MAG: threonine synthase [Elusimicrobiota bacterium]|jgi:threonine synthase|nr:threonine synthase [Elusimicrobiota bacterium]
MKKILHLQCVQCGKEHKTRESDYLCNSCGQPLQINYDYKLISKRFDYKTLENNTTYNMWRYIDILPIHSPEGLPPVQVGWTPLYTAEELADQLGISKLYIKDEGRNPTGSIKDRGSAVAAARALELDAEVITDASSGNASDSLACLTCGTKLKTVIFAPKNTPREKLVQLYIYGAHVVRIDGDYDQAYELCRQATETYGWYNRAAGFNPYGREGKKTCAFEICEQLHWEAPDIVIAAAGDGSIISGLWRGFNDFQTLGIIDKLPQIIAVQAQGSASLKHAFDKGPGAEAERIQAGTIADSICVNYPRDSFLALQALRESGGTAVSVSDGEIIEAIPQLARSTSVFAEPGGAAVYAGLKKLAAQGAVKKDESVALIVGGNGLKDIAGAAKSVAVSDTLVKPSWEEIEKLGLNR